MTGVVRALETLIDEKQQVLNMLTRVCQTADRLIDCLNEFAPEYPQACSEYYQELDTALAAVEAAGYLQRRGSP